MIFLFRRNLFLNSLLLLPYVILLRSYSFAHEVQNESLNVECGNIISNSFISFLQSNAWLEPVFTSLLIFFHAILINRVVIKHRITKELTLIPGMIYILLVSFYPSSLSLHPILLANTFFLLAITQMFNLYKLYNPSPTLVLSGFFAALSSLFYFPYILVVFFGIYIIYILRSISILEILQMIGGALAVYILVFTAMYYFDYHEVFYFKEWFTNFSLPTKFFTISGIQYIWVGLILLLNLFFIFNYTSFVKKKSLASRKKIDTLYFWQAASIVSLFLICDITLSHILILSIPFCIFFAIQLLKNRSLLFFELLHIVLLFFIINEQYNFYNFNF